jgi:hypothetical protein
LGKVDLFGSTYIAEYIDLFLKKEAEQKLLFTYITDGIKIIGENTARFGGGSSLSRRYAEIYEKPKEPANAEETIKNIKNKLAKIGGEN